MTRVTSSCSERPDGEAASSDDRSVAVEGRPRRDAAALLCDAPEREEDVGTHTSVQDPMQRVKGMAPEASYQASAGGYEASC